jgi:transmembrane sensor
MTTASDFEAQAAAWLVKRDAGGLSAEEQAQFDEWLSSDPRARAVFLRLETAWQRSTALMRRLRPLDGNVDADLLEHSPFAPPPDSNFAESRSAPADSVRAAPADPVPMDEYSARAETGKSLALVPPNLPVPVEDASSSRAKTRPWAIFLAAAAALVLVAVGSVTWLARERNGWHEYSTDFGSLERIVLDDGSIVSLNTNSAMRVRLTPELRHIVLERGEALFKVAQDKSRPFDVEAGDTVVRAVGTEFSVRVRDSAEAGGSGSPDVEVLVKEGRVAIDPPKTQKPLERAAALPSSTSTLSAGEAVVISATRVRVEKVADVEVNRKLSWTEGRLWFERQTLKDVVAEFNRYNRRQMVIADPAIENLRIGGGFEATDPESFIAALERTLGVRAFPSPSGEGDEAEIIRLVGTQQQE